MSGHGLRLDLNTTHEDYRRGWMAGQRAADSEEWAERERIGAKT